MPKGVPLSYQKKVFVIFSQHVLLDIKHSLIVIEKGYTVKLITVIHVKFGYADGHLVCKW